MQAFNQVAREGLTAALNSSGHTLDDWRDPQGRKQFLQAYGRAQVRMRVLYRLGLGRGQPAGHLLRARALDAAAMRTCITCMQLR